MINTIGDNANTYLNISILFKCEKDVSLMMPDEKYVVVDVQRKTKAPGLLTLSQVSTADKDGHSTADKKRAAYYEVEPECGCSPQSMCRKCHGMRWQRWGLRRSNVQ